MRTIAAFDFDGLLVDALEECVLVSWNGFHKKGVEFFSAEGMAAIPEGFVSTFKNHRNFARHLGHFISPFHLHQHFSCQADFDAAFSRVSKTEVAAFAERVTGYRHAVRRVHYQRWLQYHAFYPGVLEMLMTTDAIVHIVTGKDAASVEELLQVAGVPVPPGRIFGECKDKIKVLHSIARTANARPRDVCFFDDSLPNARAAQEHGFRAFWATWGYNAPEHWKLAQEAGLPAISLDDFTGMKWSR